MKDEEFTVLFESLKALQKEDLKGGGVRQAMRALGAAFSERLTTTQAKTIEGEFPGIMTRPPAAESRVSGLPGDVKSFF